MPYGRNNLKHPTIVLTCVGCGQPFSPWRANAAPGPKQQRYCSAECKTRAGLLAMHGKLPDAPSRASSNPSDPSVEPLREETTEATEARDATDVEEAGDVAEREADAAQRGREWRLAGERNEKLTARALQLAARRGGEQTLILAGHGANLSVRNGGLVVREGRTHSTAKPTEHCFYRGIHDIGHIVCIGTSGTITMEALRWLHAENITLTLLERDGEPLASLTGEQESDARLRRAQYLAQTTGQDIAIARAIVREKIQRQRHTAILHPEMPGQDQAISTLDTALAWLDGLDLQTPTGRDLLADIRAMEARAARAYFTGMQGIPLMFAKRDSQRIPPHWRTITERSSPLAPWGNARHAVNPFHALLNMAYSMAESQTRAALAAAGFDTAAGFLHVDRTGRDSLVYDALELSRAAVDALVLTLIARTTFGYRDFTRDNDGSVRLHPQLSRLVVATCRIPDSQVTDDVRWLRTQLLSAA